MQKTPQYCGLHGNSIQNLTPFPSPQCKATVYTQVGVTFETRVLPPLIPPMDWGETRKSSSLPFPRGGLGWGNSRTGSDSITCVYTVALLKRGVSGTDGVRFFMYLTQPRSAIFIGMSAKTLSNSYSLISFSFSFGDATRTCLCGSLFHEEVRKFYVFNLSPSSLQKRSQRFPQILVLFWCIVNLCRNPD
jgi:hypothetical protein